MTAQLRMTDWLKLRAVAEDSDAFLLNSAPVVLVADPAAELPNLRSMASLRSLQAMFTVTGSAGETIDADVYAVQRICWPQPTEYGLPTREEQPDLFVARLYGQLTGIEASDIVGVDGTLVTSAERFGDAGVWTKSDWGDFIETAYGRASSWLAAAGEIGTLIVPDFGDNWGWAIDLRVDTADGANAVLQNGI